MNRYPVTPRQQEFLSAIREYKIEYSRPPMIVDLARRFGMTRQSGAHIIRSLVRKGLVRMVGTSRHEVIELVSDESTLHSGSIPLLGHVTAGLPILAVENHLGSIPVDQHMLRRGAQFALRVKGDSMIDAGIFDRDTVIIRPQATAEKGDIVLSLIGEEATIKRLDFTRDGRIKLRPENPQYKPIIVNPSECQIQGVVIGLFRELNEGKFHPRTPELNK